MKKPTCPWTNAVYDQGCCTPHTHEGWSHAKSLEEVVMARKNSIHVHLGTGLTVATAALEGGVLHATFAENVYGRATYMYNVDGVPCFLIEDTSSPSDEEIDAAIRSLTS